MSHFAPAASSRVLLLASILASSPHQLLCIEIAHLQGQQGHAEPPFGPCDEANQNQQRQTDAWENEDDDVSERRKTYILQRVGLQGSGILQPRSPSNTEDGLCLTGGQADSMGGMSLYWSTCQGMLAPPSVGSEQENVAATTAQEFHLDWKGRIRKDGLCIRRMVCGKVNHAYDLGPCDGLGQIIVFVVKKPAANNMERLMTKGSPIQAVKSDLCRSCGPYVLLDRCRSEGGTATGASGCTGSYQPAPGWTKSRSQYVGDDAVNGHAKVGPHEGGGFNANSILNRLRFTDVAQREREFSGLASTPDEGVCGSYVGDGSSLDSVFFFHRIK